MEQRGARVRTAVWQEARIYCPSAWQGQVRKPYSPYSPRSLNDRHADLSLIGDHIDYVLFGVFPAAVEQDILIACGPSDANPDAHPGSVAAHNLDPRYGPQSFAPMLKSAPIPSAEEQQEAAGAVRAESWYLDINKRELRWESYVKAGYYVRLPVPPSTLRASDNA